MMIALIGYVTTLHHNFDNLWDETRLFLQTRFQVPHVCHVLLMRKPYLIHQERVIVAILERLSSIVEKLTFFEVGFFGLLSGDTGGPLWDDWSF